MDSLIHLVLSLRLHLRIRLLLQYRKYLVIVSRIQILYGFDSHHHPKATPLKRLGASNVDLELLEKCSGTDHMSFSECGIRNWM